MVKDTLFIFKHDLKTGVNNQGELENMFENGWVVDLTHTVRKGDEVTTFFILTTQPDDEDD